MGILLKKMGLAFELARWRYTPLGLLPVLLGSSIAWHDYHRITWWSFLFCLAGIFFAHLGADAANDYFDYKKGVDRFAYDNLPEIRGSGVCGSGVLTTGRLSITEASVVIVVFFAIALASCVILTITSGWFVLFLAVMGFLLGFFYCAPPISLSYLGHAIGEFSVFLAFGPLPVMGSYYVQTGSVTWEVFFASLPTAFLTTAVVFNQHFSHVEADRAWNKLTPVVIWGEKKMRIVSRWILASAYISIIIAVTIQALPVYSLVALLVAPMILIPAFRLPVSANSVTSLAFLFKVVKANLLTSLVMIISLLFY